MGQQNANLCYEQKLFITIHLCNFHLLIVMYFEQALQFCYTYWLMYVMNLKYNKSTFLSLIITRICIKMYNVNVCLHINRLFCIFECLFIMTRNNWARQIYPQYFDVLRPFKHEYHQNNDGPFYIFLDSCKLLYQQRYIYSDIMH